MMNRQRLFRPFAWAIILMGAAVVVLSVRHFPAEALDLKFFVLAAVTLCLTSRILVNIPRVESAISVSDTLIFLTLMLFGGEPAILLNAAESALSSHRLSKNKFTLAFNTSAMALSTAVTAGALVLLFGSDMGLDPRSGTNFVCAICVMALVQYVTNSGTVAMACSLKVGEPFFATWHKHYLWTSITYLAGASAAGIIATLMRLVGPPALLVATPIIAIVYFTYRTYLKNVEAVAQQAEQARRHVEELSHYISEQERIREQYAQIEKLSALGELASGVAHDFNNTLAGILGRAQLLARSKDPEKIRRGLELIIKTAEDGAKTVKRIQDFARQRRDHDFEPVAVDQLLLDVSEITRPRWRDRAEAAGVHINLELRVRSNATVMGDGSELREVLVNMVFNAVDAMPEGGRLTLTSEEEGEQILLSVSDTGTGMSEEVRSRVFDPFFTTKGKAGMGLGLPVSYGIVRRHEGAVEVESELGKGTTFRIKLPAAKVPAAPRETPAQAAEAAPMPSAPRPIKVLVADDEPAVRDLLCDILRGDGHEVCAASSGFEALERFREASFDAVFTDLGMPGMSGWELAGAVREIDGSVPLAVITGWGENVGSESQRAAGVDWVVTKPFTAERIAELAVEVARRKSSHAEGRELTYAA